MIVREARAGDANGMTDLINAVIAIGGTTAHQTPKSEDKVLQDYIVGSDVICAFVAEEAGAIIGWQSVGLWQGEADIGTFVRPGVQAKGIGSALFAATRAALQAKGVTRVMAVIRADNTAGLAYYGRMGFRDTALDPDWALADGRIVGRVIRHLVL
jgi:L-amino acid N-acyltransferase YncA